MVPEEYGSTTMSSAWTGTCSVSGGPIRSVSGVAPVGLADHEDLLDGGPLGGGSGHVEERRHGDEQPGVRVDELVVDLALDVRRVDRRDDPAGVGDAVEDDGVLRDVRGEQGEGLAGLEAARHQAAGQRAHALEQAAVRQRASARAVDQGRLVGELLGSCEHVVGQGEVGDLDLGQRAGVDHAHSSVGTCPETCPEPTDRPPPRHKRLGYETHRPRGALTGGRTAGGLRPCHPEVQVQRPRWTTSA